MNSDVLPGYCTYDELQVELDEELVRLNRREQQTYWPRYMLRRIPLYGIPFLVLFLYFFFLGMSKNVGEAKVKIILAAIDLSWIVNSFSMLCLILISVVSLLSMLIQWWIFSTRGINENLTNDEKQTSDTWNKFVAHFFIIVFLFSNFLIVQKLWFSIYYGCIVFLILTFLPLIADRTLGFTRRNERIKLMIRRVKRLREINYSRKKLDLPFEEKHVLEYMKILDDADHSKNQDTVSDTSFLINQLVNLKSK